MDDTGKRAEQLYSRLVGWRTGIIKTVAETPRPQGEPPIFAFSGISRSISELGEPNGEMTFAGAGFSPESAMMACLGEAVERYCCRFVDRNALTLAGYRDLRSQAVDPASWSLFSPAQYAQPHFPFTPLHQDTQLRWTQARDLVSDESRLVPACFVYMPYEPSAPEPLIAPAISTGLSCASSYEEALLRGLYEVIERDALAITWLKRVPTWELVDMPAEIAGIFEQGPIKYHIYDITSDVNIPVYLVLSVGDSEAGSIVSVGVACNADPLKALSKAFLENAQGRLALPHLRKKHAGWTPQPDFANVKTFEDHALVLTCRPDLLQQINFLGAKGRRSFEETLLDRLDCTDRPLNFCIEQLDRLGLQPFAKELTTEDIRGIGLSVVRAMIPGMQPLHGTHILPFLGGKRLQSAPEVFGVPAEAVLPPGRFNPIPHPLP